MSTDLKIRPWILWPSIGVLIIVLGFIALSPNGRNNGAGIAQCVTSPSSQSNRSPSASNIYKNSELGFSFTIPSGYAIQTEDMFEGARGVKIRFAKKENDLISRYNFSELTVYLDSSSLDSLKKNYEGSTPDILLTKTTSIKIDQTDGVKYETGGFAHGFHVIGTNGKLVLEFNNYPSDTSDFIDQVITSLKFL